MDDSGENMLAVGERGNGSGDGRWHGEERHGRWWRRICRAKLRKCSIPGVSAESPVFLVPRPNSESSSSCFASNSSPSSRLLLLALWCKQYRLLFRVSTSKSSIQFSVCSAVVRWFASCVNVTLRVVCVVGWSYYCSYPACYSPVRTRNYHPSSLRVLNASSVSSQSLNKKENTLRVCVSTLTATAAMRFIVGAAG